MLTAGTNAGHVAKRISRFSRNFRRGVVTGIHALGVADFQRVAREVLTAVADAGEEVFIEGFVKAVTYQVYPKDGAAWFLKPGDGVLFDLNNAIHAFQELHGYRKRDKDGNVFYYARSDDKKLPVSPAAEQQNETAREIVREWVLQEKRADRIEGRDMDTVVINITEILGLYGDPLTKDRINKQGEHVTGRATASGELVPHIQQWFDEDPSRVFKDREMLDKATILRWLEAVKLAWLAHIHQALPEKIRYHIRQEWRRSAKGRN